jgi:hypothetical protein
MNVKQRIRALEKDKHGSKPPFTVLLTAYVERTFTNENRKEETVNETTPVVHVIPDGPLGFGKKLHIKPNEPPKEFIARIQDAYVETWGTECQFVCLHPSASDI